MCKQSKIIGVLIPFILLISVLRLPGQAGRAHFPLKGVWPGFVRGSVTEITVVSNLAYMVLDSALVIYDVSNPAHPFRVGGYASTEPVRNVHVVGDYAYLFAERWVGEDYVYGFEIIDVIDPTQPRRRGRFDTGNARLTDLYVAGQRLYLSARSIEQFAPGTLEIFDISNPGEPIHLASHEVRESPSAALVVGRYAYLLGGDSPRLEIFDVSDPLRVQRIGAHEFDDAAGYPYHIQIAGDYAYVSCEFSVEIIDVGDPAKPLRTGGYPTAGARGLPVGGYLYLSGEPRWPAPEPSETQRGLEIVDVSDPANPVRVGLLPTLGSAIVVDVEDNYAYLADGEAGFHVIDVSDPSAPQTLVDPDLGASVMDVHVAGDYAYLIEGTASRLAALSILDVSNPATPRLAGRYVPDLRPGKFITAGNQGFIMGGTSMGPDNQPVVDIVDLRSPTEPVHLGRMLPSGWVSDMCIVQNHAFLAESVGETASNAIGVLEIFDVSDPAVPVQLGTYVSPGGFWGIAVANGHAYLAGRGAGLQIVDVHDPTNPTWVSSFNTNGAPESHVLTGNAVKLVDHYAFLAGDGFHILDVRDPANPVRLFGEPGFPLFTMSLEGRYAAVTFGFGGWPAPTFYAAVVNVGDPGNPIGLGVALSQPRIIHNTAIAGKCLYIASGLDGLLVYEIDELLYFTSVTRGADDITLKWQGVPGIKLQRTHSLSAPNWTDVPGSEGQSIMILPIESRTGFFRLVGPER